MPELTPLEWVANAIGFAGYALFAASPMAKSRTAYLVLHGIAMVPIAAHYVMLGAPAGAVLSLVYLGADIVGGRWPGSLRALGVLVLAALAAFAPTYSGPADLLGLFGTLVFVASRAVSGHAATLAIAAVSTLTWGAYGWFEQSYSQVLFSALYVLSCLTGLVRIARARKAAS